MTGGGSTDRLRREREHHREIADRAEIVWQWDSPVGRRRARRRASMFVEHGGLAPGVRALEVGCGTGVFLEMTAASGASIDALDLSTELLAQAKRRLSSSRNVRLSCGNVEHMPFPSLHFDVVYGSSVLHHLSLRPALAEIRRVLKPGGRIVFAEPNLMNPHVAVLFTLAPRGWAGLSHDEMAFTRFRARRLLEQAGFDQAVVTPYDFLYPLVPQAWIEGVLRLGMLMERTPLLREIAGSLLIRARRP